MLAPPVDPPRNPTVAMVLVGALFFIFGFVTWLNGPLIAFVQIAFELGEVGAFLVPMAFYLSYFFFSLPSSALLRRIGMKQGMFVGLLAMAAGALAFAELAALRSYPGALASLFGIGAGLSLLQTAVNPYVSILGPHETAARRIAIMGICNKIGGLLAPLVLGALVLHGMDALTARLQAADAPGKAALLTDFAGTIRTPYRTMALLLVVLAVGTRFSPLPEVQPTTSNASVGAARGLFRHPHVWLGALCIFVYVGVEVMAGDAIGTYGKSFDLPLDRTKFFTSFTLAAMLVGYVAGLLAIPRWVSQERYLMGSAALGVLLTIGAFCTSGTTSVAFVAALGFANAMMWPAIFPLAIRGLGALTEAGSALLVMGIVGGAIVPQLFAVGKQHHDFQWVFLLVMVPCYLTILLFAVASSRQKVPTSAT